MTTKREIDPQTLKGWLASDTALLVDVREPAEYQGEHITKAVNIPLSAVNADIAALDKKLVFQCASGNRSQQASKKMQQLAPNSEIYNLTGGIAGWKKAGDATEKSEKATRPIQQQVQVAVGSLVLLTVALGYFIHPAFFRANRFGGGRAIKCWPDGVVWHGKGHGAYALE